MSRLFERVRAMARRAPRAPAVSASDGARTYAELLEAVERRAKALAAETGVAVLDAAHPAAFLVDWFAAGLAGRPRVAMPISAPSALRALRESSLRRFPPPAGSTIFYSSGSVGPGRSVPLSEDNLAASALAFEDWGEVGEGDRVAIGLSPAQILGFVRGALNALAVGAEACFFHPRRDPLSEAERRGASLVLLPSALLPLAARHAAPSRLRALLCGGGAVDAAAADAIESRRGVPVRSGYGMTESAGLAARQPLGRPRAAGSAGQPAPGMTVAIVGADGAPRPAGEAGEVRLSGPAVFAGYGTPEDLSPFDDDGRLRTGDVGVFDPSGELFVRGRLVFALSVGDRVLCAEEVEAAIAEHPAVAEVAAARVEDTFGVLVVAREKIDLSPAAIRAHAAQRLPAFARPRRILPVTELPRTAGGKIDRQAANRWLSETPGA